MEDSGNYLRDKYSESDYQKLKEVMYDPNLEVETKWIMEDGEKILKWTCSECDKETSTEIRFATVRCDFCFRIMQASNYDIDPSEPDSDNPDWYLEKLARARGKPKDFYKNQPETQSAMGW
jgi:hypothetical protein